MAANRLKPVLLETVIVRALSPEIRMAVATLAFILKFSPPLQYHALPPVELALDQGFQPVEVTYFQAQVFPVSSPLEDEDDDDFLFPHQMPQDKEFEALYLQWNPDNDIYVSFSSPWVCFFYENFISF